MRKLEKRQEERKLDPHVEEQFSSGRLLAAISSRPGQCGRADGYVLIYVYIYGFIFSYASIHFINWLICFLVSQNQQTSTLVYIRSLLHAQPYLPLEQLNVIMLIYY